MEMQVEQIICVLRSTSFFRNIHTSDHDGCVPGTLHVLLVFAGSTGVSDPVQQISSCITLDDAHALYCTYVLGAHSPPKPVGDR